MKKNPKPNQTEFCPKDFPWSWWELNAQTKDRIEVGLSNHYLQYIVNVIGGRRKIWDLRFLIFHMEAIIALVFTFHPRCNILCYKHLNN